MIYFTKGEQQNKTLSAFGDFEFEKLTPVNPHYSTAARCNNKQLILFRMEADAPKKVIRLIGRLYVLAGA